MSYYKGREDIPVVLDYSKLKDNPSTTINFEYGLIAFPAKSVIGFDFAGSIRSLGIWGEFAYTDMEEIFHWDTQSNPAKIVDAGGKYIKYVLGFDYTTTYNLYLNFQFIHGFLHEMKKDDLKDYFFLQTGERFSIQKF